MIPNGLSFAAIFNGLPHDFWRASTSGGGGGGLAAEDWSSEAFVAAFGAEEAALGREGPLGGGGTELTISSDAAKRFCKKGLRSSKGMSLQSRGWSASRASWSLDIVAKSVRLLVAVS